MSSINAELATEYSMGTGGFSLVTSTASQTGPFVAVQAVADTIFSSISGDGISGTWSSTVIPSGTIIPGPINSFQISSGTVIAYRGKILS